MVKHFVRGSEIKTNGCAIWKSVGRRLRSRRIERSLTVARVADEIGVPAGVYEGFEAGDAHMSVWLLAKIAELFAVPVLWFFQDVVDRAEIDGGQMAEAPCTYRVATLEQRIQFLVESFRKLDLDGQQRLLIIIGALSRCNSKRICS
jgi:transcriptional regulator with XRE-family HTH domain